MAEIKLPVPGFERTWMTENYPSIARALHYLGTLGYGSNYGQIAGAAIDPTQWGDSRQAVPDEASRTEFRLPAGYVSGTNVAGPVVRKENMMTGNVDPYRSLPDMNNPYFLQKLEDSHNPKVMPLDQAREKSGVLEGTTTERFDWNFTRYMREKYGDSWKQHVQEEIDYQLKTTGPDWRKNFYNQ